MLSLVVSFPANEIGTVFGGSKLVLVEQVDLIQSKSSFHCLKRYDRKGLALGKTHIGLGA